MMSREFRLPAPIIKMNAKEKILKILKKGRKSTSAVAEAVKIDYNYATKLLEELLKENKIKKINETIATYWELK